MKGYTFGKTGIGLFRGIQLLFETRKMLDPSKVVILNNHQSPVEEGDNIKIINEASQIVDLSKDLHKQLLKLKGDFLQEGDGTVRYAEMRKSSGFKEFQKNGCSRLQNVDFNGMSLLGETEKKAFFINIYNTLTIHALVENVTDQKSVLQLTKFWQMYAYKIGKDLIFSLDDIEHGVLRCNQLHPTYKDYFFKEGDPRRSLVMKTLDPRIHFALNCGAKSCPPLRLFSAENLDVGLEMAAKNFCQNDISVNVDKKVVVASKILDWYGGDFGSNPKAIMEKIIPYCKPEVKADFEKIRDNDFQFAFTEHDWSIH